MAAAVTRLVAAAAAGTALVQDGDPSGDAPAEAGRRAWRYLLVGGLLLSGLYVVIPYGLAASGLYVATSAVAAVAVGLAVLSRRPRPYCPAAWKLVAGGLAVSAGGHAVWYWLDLRGLEPFPSVADAFYLVAYPLFGVALWLLGRNSGRRDGALSDALIVGVSAAVLGWALLIAPYVYDPALTTAELLVSAGYPVADLILLPLILRLVFLHRTGAVAHVLLLMGMLAYLVADMLYAHGNATGWYAPGGLTDALWLLAYTLFVAAVWHPSAVRTPRSRASRAELSGRRLVVLGTASVLAPTVILLTAGSDLDTVRIAAIGSIVLFLLVMHRMAGLMRQTHRQADELERLAGTDPLTGVANRRHLEQALTREVSRSERTHRPLCVAYLDLDHFKQFNDAHGHTAGDALLQELTAAWSDVLRPTDLLARVGGEEFVIVFPDLAEHSCRTVLDRLRRLVPHGQTCSAGIAALLPGETAEGLLARADRALYAAKEDGRDVTVLAPRPAG